MLTKNEAIYILCQDDENLSCADREGIIALLRQSPPERGNEILNVSTSGFITNGLHKILITTATYKNGDIFQRINAGEWEKLPPIPHGKQDPRECLHKNTEIHSQSDLSTVSNCHDCGARVTKYFDPNTGNAIPQRDDK